MAGITWQQPPRTQRTQREIRQLRRCITLAKRFEAIARPMPQHPRRLKKQPTHYVLHAHLVWGIQLAMATERLVDSPIAYVCLRSFLETHCNLRTIVCDKRQITRLARDFFDYLDVAR